MRSQQQSSVIKGSKQNTIDPSKQNVIQLKLIEDYCLYPFKVSEVNNYMEMTYTCLMDSRYREVVGVGLVAGYRKIIVVGKGEKEVGNQIQRKNQLQGDRIFGSGQGKDENKDDWVVGLVVMVDGLEQKVKGLSGWRNKGREQSQMKMGRNDTEYQSVNNPKPTLYVPYSIYLKLKSTQQPSAQLNPSPSNNLSPSQPLNITLQRFPYSLTPSLSLYPIQQQLSTLTITGVRFIGNEPAQQAQVKQLLTRMIVSPKWNAKNKGNGEFEFLVFPQERRKRVVVDLGWVAEGLIAGFKGVGVRMRNRLVGMIRENKVNNNIRGNNCQSNYLQFGIQVTPSINLREYASAKPYIAKFIPGKTLIQFQSQATSPFNPPLQPFLKTLHLSQLYSRIFSQTSYYQQLHKKLSPMITSSITGKSKQNDAGGFMCLRTDKDLGTVEFIHSMVQEQCWDRRFIKIDCQEYVTLEGFYRRLKRVSEDGECVIVVENITWLQSLSKNQDIVQQSTKSLLQKVASHITTSFSPTLLTPTVIVHFTSSIPEELPYMYVRVDHLLTNEQKHQIFSMVVEYYEVPQQANQTLQAMLGNSCGWQKVAGFLKGLKQTKQLTSICIDESKLIKTIQHHFTLQKVQNILTVSWDDIGGLQTAKQQIIQTVLLPTKHPEIFDQWIRPRTGLLFYGPPGTGKTLLGKCIAKQCKMGFISVKGPELLNMYVGESEKNVRQIFQRAKESKPCIVFMDQLDSLVPKRGNSSDGNAVMDRIVAELLMQIDMASDNRVFVIGATNRPDLLDPSILRAGRFDKQIYLGISKKKEDRVKILKAQTRNSRLQENFNFELIVDNVPENFTGADFYGLTSKAMMRAVQRSIQSFQSGLDDDPEVLITQQDFLDVAHTVKPSVTQQQLKHYQSLKQKFS